MEYFVTFVSFVVKFSASLCCLALNGGAHYRVHEAENLLLKSLQSKF